MNLNNLYCKYVCEWAQQHQQVRPRLLLQVLFLLLEFLTATPTPTEKQLLHHLTASPTMSEKSWMLWPRHWSSCSLVLWVCWFNGTWLVSQKTWIQECCINRVYRYYIDILYLAYHYVAVHLAMSKWGTEGWLFPADEVAVLGEIEPVSG